MKPVFLSYSRKNVKDVQEIADTLRAGGIRIWQDIESLATGNTDEQIRKAIQEECAVFFCTLQMKVWSRNLSGKSKSRKH